MTKQIRDEITALVENAKIVYVSSIDENGYPNTKAMLTAYHEGLKTHCLSTNTSSMRVAQFRSDPRACIYFCDDESFMGLMLIGEMKVCTDAYHRELLWTDDSAMYYPKGVTDEDYCVYEFTAFSGNYYHCLQNVTFSVEEFDSAE